MKKLMFGFIILSIELIAFIVGLTLLICGIRIYKEGAYYIAEPMLLIGGILTAFGLGSMLCLMAVCLMEEY